MFNMFKKKEENNHDILLLSIILGKCEENGGSWTGFISTNQDWKSIRFLNRRGLIKYFKNGEVSYSIVPTLFCLYLTKYKKYAIDKVYNEAVKLYNLIGEERNGDSYGKVLFQRRTNK